MHRGLCFRQGKLVRSIMKRAVFETITVNFQFFLHVFLFQIGIWARDMEDLAFTQTLGNLHCSCGSTTFIVPDLDTLLMAWYLHCIYNSIWTPNHLSPSTASKTSSDKTTLLNELLTSIQPTDPSWVAATHIRVLLVYQSNVPRGSMWMHTLPLFILLASPSFYPGDLYFCFDGQFP